MDSTTLLVETRFTRGVVSKTRLTPYSAVADRPVEAHVVVHPHRAQAPLVKTSNRRYFCLPDQRPLAPVLAVT